MAKKPLRPAATRARRSKGGRKLVRTSAAKRSSFPIDKLPPELVQMICSYLKPADLTSLRLVSRLAALIGLQYMVSEAHLIISKESFEQLKALAEHPIASKSVTSIFFEANTLDVLDRKQWEKIVIGPERQALAESLRRFNPCHHMSERTIRNYKRELNKYYYSPPHHYTENQMETAFGKYAEIIHFQQNTKQRAIQAKAISEAMKHFPNLKELIMATGQNSTSRLRKMLAPAFCTVLDTDKQLPGPCESIGLQQMRSLLLGAYDAGLKIESLWCDLVTWRILDQDSETVARMRDSISNVKQLRLQFASGPPEDEDGPVNDEFEACYLALRKGTLRDFVTAAPNLEHLQIGFTYFSLSRPNSPAHLTLKHIVGQHHWPFLKTASFKMIGTSEDDLISFCSRHASTLRSLHLDDMGLVPGDWFTAFDRMSRVLTLDSMLLDGHLRSTSDHLDFEMGSEGYYPELRDGIEAYFLGPCPSDEMDLEQFLFYHMPSEDDFYHVPNEDDMSSEYDSDDDGW